jgi:Uma2 family endonuclease
MAEHIERMSIAESDVMTAEDLLRVDIPGKWTELIRGRLVVSEPPGTYHGKVSLRMSVLLANHVLPRGAGEVFSQDTGFKISSNPDTVRAPDVAFVSAERAAAIPRRGYAPLAPDLVVEVVSPNDRPSELLAKIADWLEAGTRLAWVIDPMREVAHVHRADGSIEVVGMEGTLDGEDVLPGFSCRLAEVLA